MPTFCGEVEVVQCPFNRSHMLRRDRLQYHIVKCRKSYDGPKVPCPFNASEYIDPEDMVLHIGRCQFRAVREAHYFYSRLSRTVDNGNPIPPFIHRNLPESDENWGIDDPHEQK